MENIIVGVDGSPNSLAALRWAEREAALHHAHLVAVFAWGSVPPGHAGDGHTFDTCHGRDQADEFLAQAIESTLGSDADVEHRAVCDPPSRALLDASADADMLVVGARGHGGFRDLLLGSVSGTCLHFTSAPLAIVRWEPAGGAGRALGRIVVGADGAPSGQRALDWAVAEADRRGAELDVVRAWDFVYSALGPSAAYPIEYNALEGEARELLDKLMADRGVIGRATGRTVRGPAASVLLAAADGAELVVLGTRGHGGLAGLLLGSVTHHLAHHAPCAIVVVP
jgi:nucleotide-binding universal stress UspA family protein